MDPPDETTRYSAPAAEGSAQGWDLPSERRHPPAVDDHVVEPETREELLHGQKIWALPAKRAHAEQHLQLAYALKAHVAEGYRGALELLTRAGEDSDFAPDASVFPEAPDPETGGRQLEEIAFEICSRQALKVPTEKARELVRRGVRRVFCILVNDDDSTSKKRRRERGVLEWSRETDGWSPIPESAEIADRCFARPLPVRTLLSATEADDDVIRALRDRGRGQQALQEVEAVGRAKSILAVLEARGLSLTTEDRQRILATADVELLDHWVRRAATVSSVEELWKSP